MFDGPAYWVNVSEHDGKSLEELLAVGPPLLGPLGGAVVDATFAAEQPALLGRLRQLGLPYVVDPQSLRFASAGYLGTQSLAKLPYAPSAPLEGQMTSEHLRRFVTESLVFQQQRGVAAYVVPALPFERLFGLHADRYRQVHEVAAELNGSTVPLKPLFAFAAPGTRVLRSPYALFSRLVGLPISGMYVQPTRLNPKSDSVERLAAYANFLRCAAEYAIPTIAGRVGAFGILLEAIGVAAFDSGLAQRESFDLRSLVRARKRDKSGRQSGGRQRRVYVRQLLTTVADVQAKILLSDPSLRAEFACGLGPCRFAIEAQIERYKTHFFHSRIAELEDLRSLPTREMRVAYVDRLLERAIEKAAHVNRLLESKGASRIQFEHLPRWQAAFARMTGRRAWRRAS